MKSLLKRYRLLPLIKRRNRVLGVTRSGMVITEKVAEEMAEEFERDGLDPSKLVRCYVGHPVPGSSASNSGVAFPLSRAELDTARQRADREGRSFSDVALEELERHPDS